MNGWDLMSEGTAAAEAILGLIDGSFSKAGFANWLQQHCRARPFMDLRDFFAYVDWAQVSDMAHSVIAGQSEAEANATIDGAATAIPLTRLLHDAASDQHAAGNADAYACFNGMTVLLTALYRIAEDMGYEW